MTFKMSSKARTITIYNLRSDTNEFIGAGDAYIPPHTGLPANCTDIAPPDIPASHIAVFDAETEMWSLHEDHRGETVYDTTTGNQVYISSPGPLPENVTSVSPDGEYQKWNGKAWVKDEVAETAARLREAEGTKSRLLQTAAEKIAPLQDAVDLEIATDDEKVQLDEWKKYRVLVNRVDTTNLLFIRQGQGRTASGKPLPVITIERKAGDGHRFTLADRGAYTGVIASWLHTREPRKKETTKVKRRRKKTTKPKEPEAKQGDYLVGTDENVLVLNRTYANRSNAERAAKMQWERLQRGVASFSLQLAEGRADLYTEMPVKVTGFKQPIDDAEWTITTLMHSVSPDNGFTTSMELEVKIDDLEIE